MRIANRSRRALTGAALSLCGLALGIVLAAPGGAAMAEEAEDTVKKAPYATGSIPAYTPPEPITRDAGLSAQDGSGTQRAAPVGTQRAAPVGTVEQIRPVTIADPVYSDPDLKHMRNDPYSLSRHTATQAGGNVTPYHPDPAD